MKRNIRQKSCPFLLLFGLGCTTVPAAQTRLQEDVQSWVGARQAVVVNHWGEADEVLEIGEGQRVLQYEAKEGGQGAYPCVVIFSVNSYGFVLGSKFNGDIPSCQNFVRTLPEDERKQVQRNHLVILEAIQNLQGKAQ